MSDATSPATVSFEARLTPGDVVRGLEPFELVEIRRLTPLGNKVLVEGEGLQSGRILRRLLTPEEAAALVRFRELGFVGDPAHERSRAQAAGRAWRFQSPKEVPFRLGERH